MLRRDEMLIRMGFYCALISRELGDDSYALRWLGRAGDMTEEDYVRDSTEIMQRLMEAGKVAADEDPFEGRYNGEGSRRK